MRSVRNLVILGAAALSAILLALILRPMVGSKTAVAGGSTLSIRSGPTPKPLVQVLVAAQDLATGKTLGAGDLDWQDWPADGVNAAFISRPAPASKAATSSGEMTRFYGQVVKDPILAKEPIAAAKLLSKGEGGYMSIVLHPGTRAVSVPVTVESGAGGFILPGDHVDLVLNRQIEVLSASGGLKSAMVSDTLFKNLKVLAIDQNTSAPKDARSAVGASATLQVAKDDVEFLVQAKAQGNLVLVLRPYGEAIEESGRVARVNREQPTPSPNPTVKSASVQVVHIIRNGVATDVTVIR